MADMDFSGLQGLLQQFAPSDEDKKRALYQAIATGSFGLLGARGATTAQALGQGGLMGMQAYGNALDDVSKSKRAGLLDAGNMMGLQENMQKMQDQNDFRKLQGGIVGQNPVVQAATQGAPQAALPSQAPMGPPGPDGSMSTPAAPPAPPAGPPAPLAQSDGLIRKRAMADAYRQQAAAYSQSPLPQAQAMAQTLLDRAEKVLPKLQTTKTLTQAGQRVVVNVYDDGSHEVLPDVQPDMEKAVQLDTGSTIGAVDPFTLKPIAGGGLYNKALTPGETASNALGYANLALSRQKEAREAAATNGTKPQWDSQAGQFVYPPSDVNPTGKAISPTGFTKPDKPLTEQQGNAMMFGNRMQDANGIINGLSTQMNVTSPMNSLAGNGITNMFASDNAQKLEQAKRNFMTAGLRKESGASISKSEYDMYDKTYFPQIGDSAAVLKQKEDLRKQAIAGMQQVAGNKAPSKQAGWSIMRVD